jgi:hypothetical protein
MTLANIFEQHGYGDDRVRPPQAELHAVAPRELSLVDRLQAHQVPIYPGDLMMLSHPERFGKGAESTVREYEILLAQAALATTVPTIEQASIMPDNWRQSA